MHTFPCCTRWMPESTVLMNHNRLSPNTTVWGHSTVKLNIFWRLFLRRWETRPSKETRIQGLEGRCFPQASLTQDITPLVQKPPIKYLDSSLKSSGIFQEDMVKSMCFTASLFTRSVLMHWLSLDHISPLLNVCLQFFSFPSLPQSLAPSCAEQTENSQLCPNFALYIYIYILKNLNYMPQQNIPLTRISWGLDKGYRQLKSCLLNSSSCHLRH